MQPSISSLQIRILFLITLKTIINCNYDDTNLELNSSSWSKLKTSRNIRACIAEDHDNDYEEEDDGCMKGCGDHKNQATTLKVMVIV